MNNRFQTKSSLTKGYILAIIASACYGTNPLFALPMYAEGMSITSVLFYRYIFAVIGLGIVMGVQKISFRMTRKQTVLTLIMGLMFALSSYFLFLSFQMMDAGIASTILFTYPIMVVLISWMVFKESVGWKTVLSIILAFLGIMMLYKGDGEATLSALGIVLVLLSSLSYTIYLIGVNRSVLSEMSSIKLSFYAMVSGAVLWLLLLRGGCDLQPLSSLTLLGNALGLAVFPTVVSLSLITRSIHMIGSTPASIIGALEPITALLISIFMFGGVLSALNWLGVAIILIAVMIVVLWNKK